MQARNQNNKRGWDNCGLCPLCKREQESVAHLFYKCRYTLRLWEMLKVWLRLDTMDITTWPGERSIKDWWTRMSSATRVHRKAMASLTMLVSWTIWNE
uniref:Reverse transcriptase zinc-binding domain-containing protein n=1 Tax=Triticum urartu TaxID=4572 RepID=A0A8R7NYX6_TRIUA